MFVGRSRAVEGTMRRGILTSTVGVVSVDTIDRHHRGIEELGYRR
jgi:hypothetical protein